jgi:CRISPR-associated endoribonuclease Cas6
MVSKMTVEIKQITEMKNGKQEQLLKCLVKFVVKNDGVIPSRNAGAVHGAIMDLVKKSNPALSRKLHGKRRRKPWSFSKPFFNRCKHVGAGRFLLVTSGTTGYFHVNTLDRNVHGAFMQSIITGKAFRIGELKCDILSVDSKEIDRVPDNPARIDIQFHSPALFRDHDDDTSTAWFDPEKLVRFQHDAVTRNALMEEPPVPVDELVNLVLVERSEIRSSWAKLHRGGIDIRVNGFTGTVTLRLRGNINARKWLARMFTVSQCTGIGSRTSLGFGHCSVTMKEGKCRDR